MQDRHTLCTFNTLFRTRIMCFFLLIIVSKIRLKINLLNYLLWQQVESCSSLSYCFHKKGMQSDFFLPTPQLCSQVHVFIYLFFGRLLVFLYSIFPVRHIFSNSVVSNMFTSLNMYIVLGRYLASFYSILPVRSRSLDPLSFYYVR